MIENLSKKRIGRSIRRRWGLSLLSIFMTTSFAQASSLSFTSGFDAHINSASNTVNYGATASLFVGKIGTGAAGDRGPYRYVVQFPVTDSIASGAIIDSAKLSIYCAGTSGAAQNVSVYYLKKEWIAGSANGAAQDGSVCWNSSKFNIANWTTAGADAATDRSTVAESTRNITTTTPTLYTWTVTSAVQLWADRTDSNYGFILIGDEAGNNRKQFNSLESGSNTPYLDVWYRIPPNVTGLGAAATASAAQTDTNNVRIQYEISDNDNASVTITAQYRVGAGSWAALTNTSGDIGVVEANSPTVDRTITWNARTQLGADLDSSYTVRVIATDAATYSDTVLTGAFILDTRDPTGLASLAVTDSGISTATLNWTIATDNQFHHYEIWYGTNLANVQQRNVSAFEWDQASDPNLTNAATDTTEVQLLEYLTKYYFKIWAVDSVGNEMTVAEDSAYTLTSATPLVTGWDPAFVPNFSQSNVDSVRIGYEAWDTDDSLVTVRMEMRLKDDGAWTPWATLRNYVGGDTGSVAVAQTTDRTMWWDVSAQYGSIDTTCYVRVYAVDSSSNADTITTPLSKIDTKAPTFGATLSSPGTTSSSASLSWNSAATENHFSHYEIWYGTVQASVQARSSAAEWDNDPDDAALANKATTTTTITGLLASTTYYFKIWAVDSTGNEATVADINATTATTTNVQLTNISDNVMWQENPNLNYGNDPSRGGATTGGEKNGPTTYAFRSLLKVNNISNIPTGATIDSAFLKAYCGTAGDAATYNVSVYNTLQAWAEGTGTGQSQNGTSCWGFRSYNGTAWGTAGCGLGGTDRDAVAIVTTAVSTTGWYAWDITQTVRDWHTGALTNNGVIFVSAGEATDNSFRYFHSAEGANVPYLDVYYRLEPPDVTGLGDTTTVTAYQTETDTATIKYEVYDANNPTLTCYLQYKLSGGSWATVSNTYLRGDTGTTVPGDNAAADRTIRWAVRTHLGSSIDGTYFVRVIAFDGQLYDTAASPAFGLDTKTPVGLANLQVSDSSSFWIECSWTTVSSEGHFKQYEIRYGSDKSAVVARTASLWDGTDENGMRSASSTLTRITSLSASTKYYFKIWAVDSMGNDASPTEIDSATTLQTPLPTVTGWSQAAQVNALQTSPTQIRFGYQIIDIDDTLANTSLQYLKVSGGSWTATSNVTGQIGNGIATGSSIQDTAYWNMTVDVPAATDEGYKIRVIAVDDTNFSDTTESAQFTVDLVAPSGLGGYSVTGITATSADLSWTAATENHFHHYEIWYGANSTDVNNRAGTAFEWDSDNDATLATRTTTATTLTSLNPSTTYYFKLWAVDSAGNESTIASVSDVTVATNDPVVTGWDDSPYTNASQYSTTNVRIGYEVDDANNGTVTVSAEYMLWNTGTWAALTNTSGHIGAGVAVHATNNDTIIWNAATQLGAVDSVYKIRVIANDGSVQDTTVSDTFKVDTRAPTGLGSFAAPETLGSQIRFTWSAAADRNFNHYEIWYGTVQADVNSRSGTAAEWDNSDDGALATKTTATTTVTGLTTNTTYYWKIWAVDNIGNEATLAVATVPTKAMVTPAWSRASLGTIVGSSIADAIYVGTGGASNYKITKIAASNGATSWTYSTDAYGACRMPTYTYAGAYKVLAAAGNYVVGRRDDGGSSSQLFAPINLGSAAGNPYFSPDDSTFYVVYSGNLTRRNVSDGSTVTGWPKAVASASKDADLAAFNSRVFVASTTGIVYKYGPDGTLLGSANVATGVNLPLFADQDVLYVTPASDKIYAVDVSTMAMKWGSPVTLASANTGACFAPMDITVTGVIYVAAGKNVQKITDGGGSGSVTWTYATSDTVLSGPIENSGVVYFGCKDGRYYAIADNGGSASLIANWPYIGSSGNAGAGPIVDGTNGRVVFGTEGGNLNAFTLE